MNKLNDIDKLLIIKSKKNIYTLKPSIKNIKRNKLQKMKQNTLKDNDFINKSIIISNDNFIVDGHYRWMVKKNIIEDNTSGFTNDSLYSEDMNVIIIDYDIKTLLQKLKEFKIKYNEEYLSKSNIDINNIKEGKRLITNIKNDISLLEKNYNTLNIKLV